MIEVKILNTDQFFELVYGNGGLPKIKYLADNIKYFSYNDIHRSYELEKQRLYFTVLFDGKKIIGLAKLLESAYNKNTFWIQYLSIDPEYQSKGYSRSMVEETFKWAKSNEFTLETSGYSKIGFNTLKRLFKEYSEQYDVTLIDTRTEPEFESKILKFNEFILNENNDYYRNIIMDIIKTNNI